MNKRGLLGWLLFFMIIIFVGVFAYICLSPNSIVNFVQNQSTINLPSYNGSLQFYPNMRFPKKELTYSIDSICNDEKRVRIIQAFSRLENETSLIFFPSQNSIVDISAKCQETEVPRNQDTFIAGEGGAKTIIRTDKFNIIEQGEILLLYKKACNNYHVELHELLHVLGFKHSDNPESLMYNTSECNQRLTQDIVDELNRLYLIPELPDLYLTNITATKHTAYLLNYLDFSVDVKNQGLAKANNVTLEVYSSNNKIEEFNLESIGYGEGKYFKASNIRFSGNWVSFLVKSGEDLDLSNNRADLTIAG